MKNDNKLYIYSGLAIALSVVAYFVITNRKKPTSTRLEEISEEEAEDVVVTPSGDVISNEQANLDPTLAEILKLSIAKIKLAMLGKKVYTKLEDVNPRQTPEVNNGWFVNNGVGGKITQKGTFAGVVTDVAKDKGLMSNNDGRVYIWFKIKPSNEAVRQIKEDSSIFIPTNFDTFWLREDVIVKK